MDIFKPQIIYGIAYGNLTCDASRHMEAFVDRESSNSSGEVDINPVDIDTTNGNKRDHDIKI